MAMLLSLIERTSGAHITRVECVCVRVRESTLTHLHPCPADDDGPISREPAQPPLCLTLTLAAIRPTQVATNGRRALCWFSRCASRRRAYSCRVSFARSPRRGDRITMVAAITTPSCTALSQCLPSAICSLNKIQLPHQGLY